VKATVALYFGRIRTSLIVVQVSIFGFYGCFFDSLPLNLLLVRSHQAEINIVKCLIQGCNMCDESGSWTSITRSQPSRSRFDAKFSNVYIEWIFVAYWTGDI